MKKKLSDLADVVTEAKRVVAEWPDWKKPIALRKKKGTKDDR